MGTGLINTGVSGIQVAQLALQTASHNITNADTAGFNRQRIGQVSNLAMMTGAGFVGQGAHVSTVTRLYDKFLSSQVNTAQNQVSQLGSYYTQISQIDNMLADANSGLSSALQDFFTGVAAVAANPSQLPARQAMISSAQALTSRFQALDDQLGQMYDGVNSQLTSTVSSINTYASEIGALNQQIVLAQSSASQPANDLLDQRDQLVSELNKLVGVTTTTNRDSTLNVFIGSGQQLVVGTQVSSMTALPSSTDSTRLTVGLKTGGGRQELPESLITGGSLAGLLGFRSASLDKATNELGREAASLALTFNAQHTLGQDLLGNAGGAFFTAPTATVIASNNLGPDVSVIYTTASNGNFYTDLTGSDYRLDYDGTNLALTRLSDNKTWSDTNVANLNVKLAADPQGFTLDPALVFLPANAGASYLIEPTRNAASNISVNTAVAADARLVAAAAPIRTAAGTIDPITNAITNTNKGTASLSAGSVGTGYDTLLAGVLPLKLSYNSDTTPASIPAPEPNLTGFPAGVTVRVTNGSTVTDYHPTLAVPSVVVPYTSGATVSFMTGPDPVTDSIAVSFVISGTAVSGDAFSIGSNTSGTADGRNALLLGQLQTQNTMAGQTATFQSAYAQLVSEIGNKTREVKVTGAAQQTLLEQTTAASQSLSGVSLDEEAANLIKYQQAYQASAKVIEMASKLFDTLLAMAA